MLYRENNSTKTILIKNAKLVNENKIERKDLLIEGQFISRIEDEISFDADKLIDAEGKYLIPGIIDDQVHFREPGLTRKANIYTESKAAVAGGVTSYMEMPNTKPPALTIEELEKKYAIAKVDSLANYSFYMGTSNTNAEEAIRIDPKNICGVKVFMGSSTGNMLVDDADALHEIFKHSPTLVAIHSESETIVQNNLKAHIEKYGDDIPDDLHPVIRSVEACEESTKKAIQIANETGGRLHILHISTEEELKYFDNTIPMKEKKITSEVCAHHLYFDRDDYARLGALIKCNPAIKESRHKKAILEAVKDGRIDVLASDHAPHTWQEKSNPYTSSPSGLPLVAHTLNILLEFYHEGKISLEMIVDKLSHKVADLFDVDRRGYLKEGYYADLALLDLDKEWVVNKYNIYYKCAWSPFEDHKFKGYVTDTFVGGHHAYSNGRFDESRKGSRLAFLRD